MLILTRKLNETIVIDNEIAVTIFNIKGQQVKFGIEAPKHIGVHREEIYNLIQAKIRMDADENTSD